MKLALLIAGEYREFEIAIKSWKFLKDNSDCYFSTWDTTSENIPALDIDFTEEVTEDRIRKYLPNANIKIENPDPLKFIHNWQKMIYKWKDVITMMLDSGKEYDAVMLTRPDHYLNYEDDSKFESFMRNMEDDTLYILNLYGADVNYYIPDFVFWGKPNEIKKLLSLLIESVNIEQCNVHLWLADQFKQLYKQIKCVDFLDYENPNSLVRSNAREIPEHDINIFTIQQTADIWFCAKHDEYIHIADFTGCSENKIYLMPNLYPGLHPMYHALLRKQGNIAGYYNQLHILNEKGFDVPKILRKSRNNTFIDIEYILGHDIVTFFDRNDVDELWNFIKNTIDKFKFNVVKKDYTEIYKHFLESFVGDSSLPFTVDQLLEKLPKELDSSIYHGKFMLNNLIYKNGKFYMIDCCTDVFDSWIFDVVNLRKDLNFKLFLGNTNNTKTYDIELKYLKNKIENEYPEILNNYLYILILLRDYKNTTDSNLKNLLLREIEKEWK